MTVPALSDIVVGQGQRVGAARGRARRPARARPGASSTTPGCTPSSTARPCWSPARAARSARSSAARSRAIAPARLVLLRLLRVRAVLDRAGVPRPLPARRRSRAVIGDAKDARRVGEVFARYRPAGRVPCRGLQARAADGGGQRLPGGANNVLPARVTRGARGAAGGREKVRADLDRQGGEPGQRDGRVEAPGRDGLPGAAGRQPHAVRGGALRQRARLDRQRGAALPRADRARAGRSR